MDGKCADYIPTVAVANLKHQYPSSKKAPIIQIPNGTGAALHSLQMFEISLELEAWNWNFTSAT